MTRQDFLRNLWRWSAGVPEVAPKVAPNPPWKLDDLEKSEWSPEFEQGQRFRLQMGAFRYGLMNAPGKPTYDHPTAIIKRALRYMETGNVDLLFDIANSAMLEFEEGTHPNRHLDGAAHVDSIEIKGERK